MSGPSSSTWLHGYVQVLIIFPLANDAQSVTAGQAQWVKIFESGWDGSQWGVIKMKNNGGVLFLFIIQLAKH